MLWRCNRKWPREENYKNRWIKCLRSSFEQFRDDMYDGYLDHCKEHWEKNTSIDRIDNNGNYCKENCRRATPKQQSLNTTRNLILEKDWIKKTAKEWSEELWINENTIRVRYLRWQDPLYIWKQYKKWSVYPFYLEHKQKHNDRSVTYVNFYQRIKTYWRDIDRAINTPL